MGGRIDSIDINTVCEEDSEDGIRSLQGYYSGQADMLSSRTDILKDKDRALMKMYLRNGLTFRQIAQLAGTSETTIARRIHKLTSMLTDGEYITCLRNREKFDRVEMGIARDYFLVGISQKQIARNLGLSVYSTRKVLEKIREVLKSCGRKRGRNQKNLSADFADCADY